MPALRTLLLLLLLTATSNAWAVITPLAVSGDDIPGLPGTKFATFGDAKLNAAGQGAFAASLQIGTGGVTSANARVLVALDGSLAVLGQSGSGNVAGAPGTDYADFQEFTVNSAGDVLVRATLAETGSVTAGNKHGHWRFVNGASSLIARTGVSPVPGVTGTSFVSLGARIGSSSTGTFAFLGQLNFGNGVVAANDVGLWRFEDSTGTLVVREDTAATDVSGALYSAFGHPVINSSNHIAARTTLKAIGTITNQNRAGIWLYADGADMMLARTGSGNVPGSSGNFTVFSDPVINESGQVAFRADLSTGEQGLWRYTNNVGTQIAFSDLTNVPDVPNATFEFFSKPSITESGRLVAAASMTSGVGDVTSSDNGGLWLFAETLGSKLLVREGAGSVAGVPGASFASFPHFAPIGDTGVFVEATLQASPEIVDSSNDQGIWHVPFEGPAELIVRKGDVLAGRTISSVVLPSFEELGYPVAGVSNAAGELVFRADFTNGESGLFLYSPSASPEYAAADFNQDGFVDSIDLAAWQGAYGATSAGDTDSDGDTDGADFLTWQRQYTGPAAGAASLAVPEPGVLWLFTAAAICVAGNYGRQRFVTR